MSTRRSARLQSRESSVVVDSAVLEPSTLATPKKKASSLMVASSPARVTRSSSRIAGTASEGIVLPSATANKKNDDKLSTKSPGRGKSVKRDTLPTVSEESSKEDVPVTPKRGRQRKSQTWLHRPEPQNDDTIVSMDWEDETGRTNADTKKKVFEEEMSPVAPAINKSSSNETVDVVQRELTPIAFSDTDDEVEFVKNVIKVDIEDNVEGSEKVSEGTAVHSKTNENVAELAVSQKESAVEEVLDTSITGNETKKDSTVPFEKEQELLAVELGIEAEKVPKTPVSEKKKRTKLSHSLDELDDSLIITSEADAEINVKIRIPEYLSEGEKRTPRKSKVPEVAYNINELLEKAAVAEQEQEPDVAEVIDLDESSIVEKSDKKKKRKSKVAEVVQDVEEAAPTEQLSGDVASVEQEPEPKAEAEVVDIDSSSVEKSDQKKKKKSKVAEVAVDDEKPSKDVTIVEDQVVVDQEKQPAVTEIVELDSSVVEKTDKKKKRKSKVAEVVQEEPEPTEDVAVVEQEPEPAVAEVIDLDESSIVEKNDKKKKRKSKVAEVVQDVEEAAPTEQLSGDVASVEQEPEPKAEAEVVDIDSSSVEKSDQKKKKKSKVAEVAVDDEKPSKDVTIVEDQVVVDQEKQPAVTEIVELDSSVVEKTDKKKKRKSKVAEVVQEEPEPTEDVAVVEQEPEPAVAEVIDLDESSIVEKNDKKKKRKSKVAQVVQEEEEPEPTKESAEDQKVAEVAVDDEKPSKDVTIVEDQVVVDQEKQPAEDVAVVEQEPEPAVTEIVDLESSVVEKTNKKKKRESKVAEVVQEEPEPTEDVADVEQEPEPDVAEVINSEESPIVEETDERKKRKSKVADVVQEIEEPEPTEKPAEDVAVVDSHVLEKADKKKKRKSKVLKVEKSSEDVVAVEQEPTVTEAVDLNLSAVEKKKRKSHALSSNGIATEHGAEEVPEKKKKKKSKTAPQPTKVSSMLPDIEDFESLFENAEALDAQLGSAIEGLYSWSVKIAPKKDDLPLPFISNSNEVIWSYIKHQLKQNRKIEKRHPTILTNLVGRELFPVPSVSSEDEYDDDDESDDEEEVEEDFGKDAEGIDDDEEDADLFNLNEDDLKNIDEKLAEIGSDDDDGEAGPSEEQPTSKKYPKSSLDDNFFSVAEMNEFLDAQDRIGGQLTNHLLEDDDDEENVKTKYTYEDFFGPKEVVETNTKKAKKGTKRVAEDAVKVKTPKRVRFALDEEVEDVEEDGVDDEEMEDEEEENGPVLLGAVDDQGKQESAFSERQKKIKAKMAELEEENLKPRTWELSGEVTAVDREKNTLLEQHIDFDHGMKRAPEVTEEFTDKLEALIKQRIKDKSFDDVVRVKKIEQKGPKMDVTPLEESHGNKQSLSDVYEKEYQKAAGQVESGKDAKNEAHEEISNRMKELFKLVDALSHFDYAPPESREEVKIVSNMSSLRVEEVGMMASTDEQLLAPEEVKKRVKGEVKAEEERSKTDKLRARRKKKSKQRALVAKLGEEKVFGEQKTQKKLKESRGKDLAAAEKDMKIKASNFFSKLQTTVQKEAKEKTKKSKVKTEKVDGTSAKFKL